MPDYKYPHAGEGRPDDLPRALKREWDAREKEARERSTAARERDGWSQEVRERSQQSARPPVSDFEVSEPGFVVAEPAVVGHGTRTDPVPAVVKAFDVPFLRLMMFCIKAVFAAIPALLLLGALLWLAGQALESFFPQLVKMKILISFPSGTPG